MGFQDGLRLTVITRQFNYPPRRVVRLKFPRISESRHCSFAVAGMARILTTGAAGVAVGLLAFFAVQAAVAVSNTPEVSRFGGSADIQ